MEIDYDVCGDYMENYTNTISREKEQEKIIFVMVWSFVKVVMATDCSNACSPEDSAESGVKTQCGRGLRHLNSVT